jgi:hypothetical protein
VTDFRRAGGLAKMFEATVQELTQDGLAKEQKNSLRDIGTATPFCKNIVAQFNLPDGRTVSLRVSVIHRVIMLHTSLHQAGQLIGPHMLSDFVEPGWSMVEQWLTNHGKNAGLTLHTTQRLKTARVLAQKRLDYARDKALLSQEFFDSSKQERLKFRKQLTPLLCQGFCGKNATQYCERCRRVRYCSRKCQRQAWPLHKSRCSSQEAFCAKEWNDICMRDAVV